MTFREPITELEKMIVERLEIKNPLVEVTEESISFISGNCLFCDEPWRYKVQIATRDSQTLELTGNHVTTHICESCLLEREPIWGSERVKILYVREEIKI